MSLNNGGPIDPNKQAGPAFAPSPASDEEKSDKKEGEDGFNPESQSL